MISSTFARLASSSLPRRAPPHRARQPRALHPDVATGQQVVDDVHLREQLDVLERAGDAEVGDLVGAQAHQRRALEADVAAAAAGTPG